VQAGIGQYAGPAAAVVIGLGAIYMVYRYFTR
jgi:hypothetical protein